MDPTSTQAFFKKLADKEREKTYQLYDSRGKENVNKQSRVSNKCRKEKNQRTESSVMIPDRKQDRNWYLDYRDCQVEGLNHGPRIIDHWLCLSKGAVQFTKTIKEQATFDQEIRRVLQAQDFFAEKGDQKAMTIHIWSSQAQTSLVDLLTDYSVPMLTYGKGTWSLAALTTNKRYDLLSLDPQSSIIWKSKNPLSKVQLDKEKLMKRVFGFSCEKEKDIGRCEILAKLQFPNNSIIYFIVRDISLAGFPSSAQLMIQQEAIFENIKSISNLSVLRVPESVFGDEIVMKEVLCRLNLKIKQEQEMERSQRQNYLKCMIEQLRGELIGKQQQLRQYKQQQQAVEQQIGIPSERISMGQERYMHLKRRIKESKLL